MENIIEIFNIFHDGEITKHKLHNNCLSLEIEIEYLANLVDKNFTKFFVELDDVKDISFYPWLHDMSNKQKQKSLTDVDKIFRAKLEILESNIKDSKIEIILNQHDLELEYCGGELYFKSSSARVYDENGKLYGIEELGELCDRYWNKFAR